MIMQPDLHYEGEITKQYVDTLVDRLKVCITEINDFVPPDQDPEWEQCRRNWHESLTYAALRCVSIGIRAEYNLLDRIEDDRKCIDITLCILRDFEAAKAKGFERG